MKDPVCGMEINKPDAKNTTKMGGQTYPFCSSECKEQFDKDPMRYTQQAVAHQR